MLQVSDANHHFFIIQWNNSGVEMVLSIRYTPNPTPHREVAAMTKSMFFPVLLLLGVMAAMSLRSPDAGCNMCILPSLFMDKSSEVAVPETRNPHETCPITSQTAAGDQHGTPKHDTQAKISESQVNTDALLCQEDEGHSSPEALDDRRLIRQMERQATQLIEAEKHTDMATLLEQLENRTVCQITLPQASENPICTVQMYEKVADSVLIIGHVYDCGNCDRWHVGPASGVVLTADGIVATNYHVMEQRNAITMVAVTRNGRVLPIVEVLAASEADDLAIIRIDADGLTPAPVRADAPVGTSVRVLSHPARRFYTYTDGIISRYFTMQRAGQSSNTFTITADFARGSSGAPVFDDRANVVGFVTSTNSVYYSVEDGVQRNLQMVNKQCIPAKSLLNLIQQAE